eukprot:g4546.t1
MMLSSSTNRWRKRPPHQAGGGNGGAAAGGRSPLTGMADRRHQLTVADVAAGTTNPATSGRMAPPGAVGSMASHRHPQQQQLQPLHQFYYPASAPSAGAGAAGAASQATAVAGGRGGHQTQQQPQPQYQTQNHAFRTYHLPSAERPSPPSNDAGWVLSPPNAASSPSLPRPLALQHQDHDAYAGQGESHSLPTQAAAQPPQKQQGGGRRRQARGGQGTTTATPPTSSTQDRDEQQLLPPSSSSSSSSGGGGTVRSGGSGGGSGAGGGSGKPANATTIATLIFASLLTYALYHASVEALAGQKTSLSFPPSSRSRRGPAGPSAASTISGDVSASAAAAAAAADNVALLGGDHHPIDSGVNLEVEEYYHALAPAVTWGGAGGGGGGGEGGEGFRDSGGKKGWGKGVSVVTASAWQSLAALGLGFLLSRFWRRWRRPEMRALGDAERTRRNRCLVVFAAAHLAGTGLEYHGYGVVGAASAEVLRSTEGAFFCLLSLNVGFQRPGLASVPTLLLALGLALAATPTSGDLMAGWGGLRASLAANFLLAVRAIAAKISALFSATKLTALLQFIILLVVEVPRAAGGLAPRLLPHLWGVGVMEVDHQPAAAGGDVAGGVGVGAGDAADWSEGRERARLACLLLANGVCLYGHVLVLFLLLSRLSATMFVISSGYVRAALVFVLLLSLEGSAAYPRSVGMALATVAVSAHFYRTYVRGRTTSSLPGSVDNTSDLLCEVNDGGESGTGACAGAAGDGATLSLAHPFRRRLPRSLHPETDEVSAPPAAVTAVAGTTSSSLSSSACSAGLASSSLGRRAGAGGGGAEGGPGLFVPLLGTRLDSHRHQRGSAEKGVSGKEADHHLATPEAGGGGRGDDAEALSPSRFTWRWMGLRPAETEPEAVTTTTAVAAAAVEAATTEAATAAPLLRSPVPLSRRLSDHQQLPREASGGGGGEADGSFGLRRFGSSHRDHPHDHVLSPPPAFGTVPAAAVADGEFEPSPSSLPGYPRCCIGASGGGGENSSGDLGDLGASRSTGLRYPFERFDAEVSGNDASFAAGPADDLRRPLPRPMLPGMSARAQSSGGTAEDNSSASVNLQPLPTAARVARPPPSPSAGGSHPSPAYPAIGGTRAVTGGGKTVTVRRLGGAQNIAVPGVDRGTAGHRVGAAGAVARAGGWTEAGGDRVRMVGDSGGISGGGSGGRLDETMAVALGAGTGGGGDGGAPASSMSSSPTSSSSFSLNGFEVIDSEDMWK